MKVSLSEWLDLSDIDRQALVELAESKSRQIESHQNAHKEQLEKMFSDTKSKLKMPFDGNPSVLNRLY